MALDDDAKATRAVLLKAIQTTAERLGADSATPSMITAAIKTLAEAYQAVAEPTPGSGRVTSA